MDHTNSIQTVNKFISLSLLILLLFPHLSKPQIEVHRGRETFISIEQILPRGPLLLHIPCVVALDESATHLKVGIVRPQSFSCSSPDRLIRYVHNGNPFLSEDDVQFVVYYFKDFETVEQKVQLMVKVLEPRYSIFVEYSTDRFLPASTSRFTRIGWSVVGIRYNVSSDVACNVEVNEALPVSLLYHPNKSRALQSSFSCQEFPKLLVKLPEENNVPHHLYITAEIENLSNSNSSSYVQPTRENYYFTLAAQNLQHSFNLPPQIRLGVLKLLYANQYSLFIVPPNVISVTDDDTPIDSVALRILKPGNSIEHGFLVHLSEPWKMISTFKYGELLRRRIAYRGPTQIRMVEPSSHEICLLAVDFHFAESRTVCFSVVVRPGTNATEPKVARKNVVVVARGKKQAISLKHLVLVNMEGVTFQLKGGPYHGSLTIDNNSITTFSSSDITNKRVFYTNDGNHFFEDRILLKVSNSVSSTRVQLDIRILSTVDQTAPYLMKNEILNVTELSETSLTLNHLDASVSDRQQDNEEIIFTLITTPNYGTLMKKMTPLTAGIPIHSFNRKDVEKEHVYYRAASTQIERKDSFRLKVHAALISSSNISKEFNFDVNIQPKVKNDENEKIIKKCSDLDPTLILESMESPAIFSSKNFCYSTNGRQADDIEYHITFLPFFKDGLILSDAGDIIELSEQDSDVKNERTIDVFTQSMIEGGTVAYRPPSCRSIDRSNCFPGRSVEFRLTVTCHKCTNLYDETFHIQLPLQSKMTSAMFLKLGETKQMNDFLANSLSNISSKVGIKLLRNPQHGVLVRDGKVVQINTQWRPQDFLSKKIWYQHIRQSCSKDEISFTSLDAVYRFNIIAQPDSRFFVADTLTIANDSSVLLHGSLFSRSSSAPIKDGTRFEVLVQPQRGHIFARTIGDEDSMRDSFTFDELKSNGVRYQFSGEEVRSEAILDSFLILVDSETSSSQVASQGECDMSIFNVSVIIKSQNKLSSPVLLLSNRTINVSFASRSAVLGPRLLSAATHDGLDEENLRFVILQSPVWGRIVLSSGGGRSTSMEQVVNSFTKAEVMNGRVRYLLGNIYGRINDGKLTDSFHLYVTDGERNSSVGRLLVNISMPLSSDNGAKRRNHRNVNKHNQRRSRTFRSHKNNRINSVDIKNISDVNNNNHNNQSINLIPSHRANHDRRKDNFQLKVGDIFVSRGGKRLFTVAYRRPSQKRRSMTESTLSLDVPPSHGRLVLLKVQDVNHNNNRFRSGRSEYSLEASKSVEGAFQNVALPDISNEIRMMYKHDGSESTNDNFVLSLSNDNKSIKKAVIVKVAVKEKKTIRPESIFINDLLVTNDSPITLSASNLLVKEEFVSPEEVEFEIAEVPKRGFLKVLDQQLDSDTSGVPLQVGNFFTQLDVIENRVFYVLSDSNHSNDSFVVRINGGTRLHTVNIYFEFSTVVLTSSTIWLDGEGRHCLKKVLFEEIKEHKLDKATCSVVSLDRTPNFGHVGLAGFHSSFHQKMTRFTMEDLKEGLVCYSHNKDSRNDDDFELLILDTCNSKKLASKVFHVKFNEASHVHSTSPLLNINVPLMVVHGDRVAVTSSNLHASRTETDPSQVFFVIVDPPRHGKLLSGEMPVNEFSQQDVDSNLVSYQSSRIDDSMMDYFLFYVVAAADKSHPLPKNLTDGKASFFSILIQPASKTPPKLIVNSTHRDVIFSDGKFLFPINASHLKASHSTFLNRDLVYHIKKKPKHGHLEFKSSGRQIGRKFTQKDVDDERLVFVIRNDTSACDDSFTFKLVDPNKNTIDNQRLSFEWSIVDFQSSHLKVCWNVESFIVPVLRRGSTMSSSSLEIKLKHMSTSKEENSDYYKVSNGTVVFQPGTTKVDWVLKLLEEGWNDRRKIGQRFKLVLRDAANTVIGAKDRIIVQIADPRDGGCLDKNGTTGFFHHQKPAGSEPPFEDTYDDEDYEEEIDELGRSDDDDRNEDYLESDLSYYNDRVLSNEKRRQKDPPAGPVVPPIPQPCNPSTKSLLFFDAPTSQIFKCNGRTWEKWGWASNPSDKKTQDKKESLEEKSQKTCPLGWLLFGDNCFLSSKVKMTWTEAEEICRRDGGHLTFVSSREHLAWLSGLTEGNKFWIGLNNRKDSAQWEFTGSALFTSVDLSRNSIFYNWGPHQPCVKCPRSRCVQASEHLHYSNKQCTKNRARFVCSRPSRLVRTSRRVKGRRAKYGGRHFGT